MISNFVPPKKNGELCVKHRKLNAHVKDPLSLLSIEIMLDEVVHRDNA